MQPVISVLTATYNRPCLLQEAVHSILQQTFVDFELIVINDGGEDVRNVLEAFHDPRIVYLNLTENRGKAHALNRGIEIARGQYLAYLDDDDHYYPHHLQTVLNEIEAHPEVDLVYSDFEEVKYENDPEGRRCETDRIINYSRNFDRTELLKENYITHPSVLHRKAILEKYGGFDESFPCLIDWELFHRLAFYFEFRHLPRITGEYFINREKGDHITNLHKTRPEYYMEHFYRIRRQLPPQPWNYVVPVTLVIKPNVKTENLSQFLVRLMVNTLYPCQMILLDCGKTSIQLPDAEWLWKMNVEIIRVHPEQDPLTAAAQVAFGGLVITFESDYAPYKGWLWSLVQRWQNAELHCPIQLTSNCEHSPWGWVLKKEQAIKGIRFLEHPSAHAPEEESYLVSIIIPVRNKLKFTRQCLASIQRTKPTVSYEIIVVNNASDDGTKEYLDNLATQNVLTHIINDPPLPFAASCNRGAVVAKGKYLVFLNNDTLAFPGWLEEMVQTVSQSSDVGAVGAKLLFPDRTIQHAGVAFHYFKKVNAYTPYHIFRGFPSKHPAVSKQRDFKCVTGACLLTPAGIFENLGGFDERYINCYEDVDYCLNLRSRGYRVVYTPGAELIHFEGQTPGRNDNIGLSRVILQDKWGTLMEADEDKYLLEEGFVIEENDQGVISICDIRELQQWKEAIVHLFEFKQWLMAVEEIDRFEQVVGSNKPDVLEIRGHCALGLGDSTRARMAFNNAHTLDPDSPGPRWGLVRTALAQTKPLEARARLRRLIADYPNDPRQGEWRETLEGIKGFQGAMLEEKYTALRDQIVT